MADYVSMTEVMARDSGDETHKTFCFLLAMGGSPSLEDWRKSAVREQRHLTVQEMEAPCQRLAVAGKQVHLLQGGPSSAVTPPKRMIVAIEFLTHRNHVSLISMRSCFQPQNTRVICYLAIGDCYTL